MSHTKNMFLANKNNNHVESTDKRGYISTNNNYSKEALAQAEQG